MTDEATNKKFVFLYPKQEIFDAELRKGAFMSGFVKQLAKLSGKNEEEVSQEAISRYRTEYKRKLNSCIDYRYRKEGFSIYYVLFEDSEISKIINFRKEDKLIRIRSESKENEVSDDYKDHPYPDSRYILNQLKPAEHIRVSGFYLSESVEILARNSYESEIDTLIDEDLTELFPGRIMEEGFKIKSYPSFDPRDHPRSRGKNYFEWFMKAREGKPWLWQEY